MIIFDRKNRCCVPKSSARERMRSVSFVGCLVTAVTLFASGSSGHFAVAESPSSYRTAHEELVEGGDRPTTTTASTTVTSAGGFWSFGSHEVNAGSEQYPATTPDETSTDVSVSEAAMSWFFLLRQKLGGTTHHGTSRDSRTRSENSQEVETMDIAHGVASVMKDSEGEESSDNAKDSKDTHGILTKNSSHPLTEDYSSTASSTLAWLFEYFSRGDEGSTPHKTGNVRTAARTLPQVKFSEGDGGDGDGISTTVDIPLSKEIETSSIHNDPPQQATSAIAGSSKSVGAPLPSNQLQQATHVNNAKTFSSESVDDLPLRPKGRSLEETTPTPTPALTPVPTPPSSSPSSAIRDAPSSSRSLSPSLRFSVTLQRVFSTRELRGAPRCRWVRVGSNWWSRRRFECTPTTTGTIRTGVSQLRATIDLDTRFESGEEITGFFGTVFGSTGGLRTCTTDSDGKCQVTINTRGGFLDRFGRQRIDRFTVTMAAGETLAETCVNLIIGSPLTSAETVICNFDPPAPPPAPTTAPTPVPTPVPTPAPSPLSRRFLQSMEQEEDLDQRTFKSAEKGGLFSILGAIVSKRLKEQEPKTTKKAGFLSAVGTINLRRRLGTRGRSGEAEECKCVFCEEDEKCGGLWTGEEKYRNTNQFNKIHLVVSHCKTELSWLNTFDRDIVASISITVISKCEEPVVGAPEYSKIIRLPNVGRCDHSYAYWMAHENVYTDEDDGVAVIFLKDDVSWRNLHQVGLWRPLRDILGITSVRGFSCGVQPTKFGIETDTFSLSQYHKWSHLSQFDMQAYTRNIHGYMDSAAIEFDSGHANLGDWLNKTVGAETIVSFGEVVPVCYGGVFAASASSINNRSKSLWKSIEQSLARGNNIEEGHYAERSWATLLASPVSLSQSQALLEYADFYFDSNESMRGALVHQPSLFEAAMIDTRYVSVLNKDIKHRAKEDSTEVAAHSDEVVSKKPSLYLHIGPPKHGTTTMQCTLARSQQQLNDANYHYIGINNERCTGNSWTGELPDISNEFAIEIITECFNKGNSCDLSYWKHFTDILDQYHARHHNVIFGFESLGTINFEAESNKERLAKLSEKWDVQIVLTYRHFHDVLPSFYMEMYKTNVLHLDPDDPVIPIWKEEGGIELSTFTESMDSRFEKPVDHLMGLLYNINVLSVYRNFLQLFDKITVTDLYNGDSAANWICSLPGADTACAHAKIVKKIKYNTGEEYADKIASDLVAVAGRKAGMIDPSLSREFVDAQILAHLLSLGEDYSLPMKCLTEIQEKELIKVSKKIADELKIEADIYRSFVESKKKKKFCGFDAEAVLQDSLWAEFFSGMKGNIAQVE